MKSVQMQIFSWSVFSCIRTEFGDLLRKSLIRPKYRKLRTRETSVFGQFLNSEPRTIPQLIELLNT